MKSQPKIFAVSDGRAGIERQAQAMANALADVIGANIQTIRLNPKPPQALLPPDKWPMPISALPREQQSIFYGQMPNIWIGNGRRAIPYSLWIKANRKNVLTIQIQDPKIPSKNFDFVIAPMHDEVKGENVFETLGGLVYYSKNDIAKAIDKFEKYKNETCEKILVILGGDSKTHKFSLSRANEIISQLNKLKSQNRTFWISTSRRTPENIADAFRNFAKENNYSFFGNEKTDGENPFLSWLALSDIALITEDSANMLSDAAFFGLPINLLRLEGSSKKFDRLHKSFEEIGALRIFNGEIQKFTYKPINSIENIAKSIANFWQSAQNKKTSAGEGSSGT